jgi:hypothetical protein
LDSPTYCGLSFKAVKLLVDLGAQFRGHNNGDMSAAWSLMKRRGWKSKDTLHRALVELRAVGMIELTRQGSMDRPSLFAFTWLPIDECGGKLEVRANPVPSNKWRQSPQARAA